MPRRKVRPTEVADELEQGLLPGFEERFKEPIRIWFRGEQMVIDKLAEIADNRGEADNREGSSNST